MPQTIQRSFVGGEISPSLQARADTVKYATGLNLCENMFVRAQGGAYSRPGFSFRGEVDDSTTAARLIPFSFNTQQTYMLVFQNLTMQVIKNGGFVLKPAATITNITNANPAVVTTSSAHGFTTGENVTITGVVGMTEVNGNTYAITVLSSTTFQLDGVDSTAYGAYTSGGSAQSDGIYTVVTPYVTADLFRLGYTQSADVMTITHPSYDVRNLSRLADDNWTLATVNYASTVSAPTFSATPLTATITTITNAADGNVTTSAAHGFSTGDIIEITGVNGMIEVDNRTFIITVNASNQFYLNENTTTYGTYTSGGTATRYADIRVIGTGGGSYNKTYRYVVTAVDSDGIESLVSAEKSLTTNSLTGTYGIRLNWDTVAGADYYRVYKDPSENTGVYGWIGDSKTNVFDDYNIAPLTSDAPPTDRQPFSGSDNKPAAVTYYQQRQVFANTNNEPQTVFTTQTGNFNSLRASKPSRDTDAITFSIASQQVDEIRHLLSLNALIILTSGGEWVVSEGQDNVLTPSTIGFRPQSYNGASWVKPAIVNNTALYLQQKNARIRDLAYQFSSDSYIGNDLSIMAEHLIDGYEIVDMAYADEPYGILWCVRDDGVLLGLTYQREHQVWAWHRHTTDGLVESVATISEDGRDAVYVIVNRTIGGTTKRYVERLEKVEKTTPEDCFYVDSGLSYNGLQAVISGATQANPVVITTLTAHGFSNGDTVEIRDVVGMTELNWHTYTVANATTYTFELSGIDGAAYTAYTTGGIVKKVVTSLTGLSHLEGKAVDVLADGNYIEGHTVSSGGITLATPANTIHVGLPYTPAIELLDLDGSGSAETIKAEEINVSKVTIEMQDSRGGWVGPRVDLNSSVTQIMREIKPRFDSDSYGTIQLKTYKAEVFIEPNWGTSGGVRIEQRAPLPMNILSVIPKVDIGGS